MEKLTNHPFRSVLLLLTAAFAAVALAACGGDDEGDTSSGPDPATVAPASAPMYMEATIKPEGDAKDNLLGSLNKVLGTDDSGAMISDQINAAFEGEGVNFDEDINSWLGSTMGGWISSFSQESGEGAVAFAVTDEGAAQEGVDKLAAMGGTDVEEREYEGTSYKFADDVAYGIVGDFMVLGTEKGFQEAVDASAGDSLADDSTATDALDSAPDGTLAEFYVDPQSAIDAAVAGRVITQQELQQSGVTDQLDSYGDQPVVMSMGAGEDNFSFEASGPAGQTDVEGTDIMTSLPAGAWMAFGAPDVGGRIAESYQQFVDAFETGLESGIGDVQDSLDAQGLKPTDIPEIDVEIQKQLGLDITKDLGWIGNMGGFIQGASIFDLGGGIVIETDDPDAAAAALAKLRTALGRERSLKITETEDGGFNIQTTDAPIGAEVGIRDDKVVFAFAGATIDDVLEPSETLGDSDTFSSADGALGDLDPSFYMDLAPILSLVESSGGSSDPDYAMAAPYLSAIDYMIAGGGVSDDRATGRFVIGVQEQSQDSSGSAAAAITP